MLVDQDTIVACGIARSDSFPYPQCLLVTQIDSIGNILKQNLICDSLGDALSVAVNWTDIVTTSDGGYAFTAAAVYRTEGMFVKLRHDLSVEFIQEYIDTINLVEFYNSIIEMSDGYLLGGHLQRPNYLQDAFLRKVDKQGNSIWFSYYGEYDIFDMFSNYCQLTDSTVAFIGGFITNENSLQGRGPWICIVNSDDGEILIEWKPLTAPLWFLHYLYPTPNGEWITYGKNITQITPVEKVQSFLAVIDTNFQIIEVRTLGVSKSNFFWHITPDEANQFIAVGQINSIDPNNEPGVYGWLFKFSTDPDSLWSLTLAAPPTVDIAGSGNYLGGVGVLSSGNIIAGGYASAGNDIWPWLVKVTPDGCVDSLWCVATPAWEAAEPQLKTPGVKVYPNPVHDRLFFELADELQPASVALLVSDGRVVRQSVIPGPGFIDVADLPAGLYCCRFVAPDGSAEYRKIVIAR